MPAMNPTSDNRSVFAAVLAAGRSRRFGRSKLLEVLDGEPLAKRAAGLARKVCGDRTVLVTGYDGAAVRAAAGNAPQFMIVNDRYEDGMGLSIALAANAVAHTADALLLLFADQPLVTVEHLETLVNEWSGADNEIVATGYAGTQGPPVLFPRGAFAALGALSGDDGARRVLQDPAFDVRTIRFEAAAIDIDTPADLRNCKTTRPSRS
jgi:molybdenum cofactor cytidylyltransferase